VPFLALYLPRFLHGFRLQLHQGCIPSPLVSAAPSFSTFLLLTTDYWLLLSGVLAPDSSPKSQRREKDRRFWPSHQINLEQLERRYYPGSTLDVLGWTMLGSSLAFLSWDRFAAAMENRQAFADGLGADALPGDGRRVAAGLFETLGPDPFRTSLADLVVAPGREKAATSSGRVGGEERARASFQENVAWDWVGGLLANDGETAGRPARVRLDETRAADRALPHGGDGATPAFAERATVAEGGLSSPAPYGNAAHAAYSSSAFDAAPFYGSGQTAQVRPPAQAGNATSQPAEPPPDPNGGQDGPLVSQPGHGRNAPTLQRNYSQLPLSFEPNVGQSDARVQFVSRGQGYNIFLTSTEAVFILHKPIAPPQTRAVLRMGLVGANANAVLTGQGALPGVTNYLLGNDPTRWHTRVTNYSQVLYHNVYAGIDLLYYGDAQRLEYDFVVSPGANPAAIQLAYQGTGTITLDSRGNLTLPTMGGNVVQRAPVVYQLVGGARTIVSATHVLLGPNQVGFQIGAYDHTKPLYVDPVLSYSTYLGGTGTDSGYAVAVDTSGNAYVTGATDSADFPTVSPLQPMVHGTNVFITKLNALGTGLVYSTFLGGTTACPPPAMSCPPNDRGHAIAVDDSGNAYVAGETSSTDFPTRNALQSQIISGPNDPNDAFVTKLSPDGSSLVYSTYLGGNSEEELWGIAVNHGTGEAYVAGETFSNNLPVTPGAFQPQLKGTKDAFVAKLSTDDRLVYLTYLGGLGSGMAGSTATVFYGNTIAVDDSGSAYVTGRTDNTGTADTRFPTTSNALQPQLGGNPNTLHDNAFVTELSPIGALLYSSYLGGSGHDYGSGIAVDATGGVYVTGQATSADFPTTTGVFQPHLGTGKASAFVTKLDLSNLSAPRLAYSTYLGGNGTDTGRGIAVCQREAYVTGSTSSTNFPTADPVQSTYGGGGDDAFVTQLKGDGTALRFSTYLGGSGDDHGFGIALDPDRAGSIKCGIYVTGDTSSTDFPTASPFQNQNRGGVDAFVVKLGNEAIQRLNDIESTWLDVTTATLAPNTGTLRVTQPLDFFQSHNTGLDGFSGLGFAPALVYNSDTVYAQPIAEVTVGFDPQLGVPDILEAKLFWKDGLREQVEQPYVNFDPSPPPGGEYLLAVKAAYYQPSTGRYPWRVHVYAHFRSGGVVERDYTGHVQVSVTDDTNASSRDRSPFGPGWSLAGLNRLVIVTNQVDPVGGVLMVFGSGQASHYFSRTGNNTFRSPPNDFGTLSQPAGPGTTFTYLSKDRVTWTYDSTGLLQTITEPHNLSVTFNYDFLGNLLSIQTPDRGNTFFGYDKNTNLVSAIAKPGNRLVTLTRTGGGPDLTLLTNPDGTVRAFAYDSIHRLTNQQWGPTSATYSYYPFPDGTLADIANAVDWGRDNGLDTRLSLTPANVQGVNAQAHAQAPPAMAVVTDANTNVSSYTLDPLGRINQLDRPGIPSEAWQRDQAGQVRVYTDARGNATTNTYDYTTTTQTYQYGSGNGDLVRIDYPDVPLSNQQFKYESMYHHLTQRQDQRGKFTTFLYDSLANLTVTIDANQKRTTQTWNGAGPLSGLLASLTDANNHTTTYQWSSDTTPSTRRLMGMTEASGYPESRFTTYLYDAAGNVTSVTTGQSNTTTYAHAVTTTNLYDGMRRVTSTSEGNGARTITKAYDAVGNVTQSTDAAGRVTSSTYDKRNHPTQTDEAVGKDVMRSSTYLYDGAGNLLAETHGISSATNYDHHVTTSYGYDALNRRTEVIEGFGGNASRTTTTLYDAVGNVTVVISPRRVGVQNLQTQFLYDALNRQTVTIDATRPTTARRCSTTRPGISSRCRHRWGGKRTMRTTISTAARRLPRGSPTPTYGARPRRCTTPSATSRV